MANFSATILDCSVFEIFVSDLKSFSIDEADKSVIFLSSSIICAEIFLDDLDILNLNLSFLATDFTLLPTLNFLLLFADVVCLRFSRNRTRA